MEIFVTVKQAGNRRGHMERQPLLLTRKPQSPGDLVREIVLIQIQAYNSKPVDLPLYLYLTGDHLQDRAATGKVGFGARRNEESADPARAVETAITAFKDGLFRLFIDDEEVTALDSPLELAPGANVTFIRFTMLAGRMW